MHSTKTFTLIRAGWSGLPTTGCRILIAVMTLLEPAATSAPGPVPTALGCWGAEVLAAILNTLLARPQHIEGSSSTFIVMSWHWSIARS
jgi:hypothetical protein